MQYRKEITILSFLNNLIKEANKIPVLADKNAPLLLMLAGIGGLAATVVSAVKATPLAIDKMDDEIAKRYEKGEIEYEELPMSVNKSDMEFRFDELGPKQIVKSCWKCYVPTVILGALSISSFIGSYKVNTARLTAMTAMYEFTANAYDRYRRNVAKVSPKTDAKATKASRDEQVKDIPESKFDGLSEGKEVCIDLYTGNVFYSTREDVLVAVNKIKDKFLAGEMFVSLNEFYDEVDADHVGVGDDVGWSPDTDLDIQFDSVLRNGKPCLTIGYFANPRFDYGSLM